MRSSFFNISNSVRQGGILSPKLFSVYMEDLYNILISSDVGCFLNNVCINHVFYTDDLCLMAPCAIALQELLNICHRYSITTNLNFNALKSFCVAFTPNFRSLLSYLFQNYTLMQLPFHILTLSNISDLFLPAVIRMIVLDDMLRQMRMLYVRSNTRLVRLFHSCSRNVLIELGRSFCVFFYCSYLWTHYNKA